MKHTPEPNRWQHPVHIPPARRVARVAPRLIRYDDPFLNAGSAPPDLVLLDPAATLLIALVITLATILRWALRK